MLTTYLLIGLLVQIVTTIERFIRGVARVEDVKESFESLSGAIGFCTVFILGWVFNVLSWPLSIVFEVINIINDR